jgi:mannose-6-phosphate isomerase-like protein (cupin superfamily)
MDRRQFATQIPAALAFGSLLPSEALAQASQSPAPVPKPSAPLKPLSSGVFKPAPSKAGQQGHTSQAVLIGMLPPGNIRLEAHESVQQPGAPHEAVGTHKHSEIWCVQRGVGSLYINGTEHRMEAGDIGLVCAGDEHWIANAGDTELAYYVLTVGPPE